MNQRKIGAILSYVSILIGIMVSLAYVPLLLDFLSVEDYGVYELIGSIISYLALMDIGLSTTISRFYVRIETAEDRRSLENMLAMALLVYIALTIVAEVACVTLYWAIPSIFQSQFTASELSLAQQMMVIVGINCAIVLPGNWVLAVLTANERFVCTMSSSILKWVLQYVLTLIFLSFYQSAITVLIVQVGINLLVVLVQLLYWRATIPVGPRLQRWDGSLARELFRFTALILLGLLVDQIFWKTGQIILGIVSGAMAVAVYGIVCKIVVSGFSRFASGISNVFLPKVTKVATLTSDMQELNELFFKVGHIQAILVWGVCACFATLGQDFIALWIGEGFAEVYPATLSLMITLCIPSVQSLALSILQAKNKLGFRSLILVVFAVINLILSVPASDHFGALGCALTTAITLFVMNVFVMNAYYSRVIGIDIAGFYKRSAPLLLLLAISAAVTMVFMRAMGGAADWGLFSMGCLLFIGVYLLLLWRFGFTQEEKAHICGIGKRLLHR